MKLAIKIHPDDNVATVVEDVAPGDDVRYMTPQGAEQIRTRTAVPSGHKVALVNIDVDEPITKYDEPIGRASTPIRQGEHVHDHNVRSTVQGLDAAGSHDAGGRL